MQLKYIFIFILFSSRISFSQTSFSNLDSLLTHVVASVNAQDSVKFMSLLHHETIYKDKKCKTKKDSLLVLNPFIESYRDLRTSIADLAVSNDYTVTYQGIENIFKLDTSAKTDKKLTFHILLLVNNSFVLKMPMVVNTLNQTYILSNPFMVMFADNEKE